MISQENIAATTPMGATLVDGGGATFRAWAPRASAVYINGTFGGVARVGQTDDLLLAKDANGYWSGFVAEAQEGDLYHFWVAGDGSSGYKRDPYARELATDVSFPQLQLHHPLCYRLPLARQRFRNTRLHQHDHLPDSHWHLCH